MTTTLNANPTSSVTSINAVYTLPPATKSEIIHRLLESKHISIQEAMTLMEKEIQFIPQYIPNSPFPTNPPFTPHWGITYTGKDVVTHI